jgi:hypothetical protein
MTGTITPLGRQALVAAAIEILHSMLDVIKAHPDGVSAGEMYANLCGKLSYNEFTIAISMLERAKKITNKNHWLKAV